MRLPPPRTAAAFLCTSALLVASLATASSASASASTPVSAPASASASNDEPTSAPEAGWVDDASTAPTPIEVTPSPVDEPRPDETQTTGPTPSAPDTTSPAPVASTPLIIESPAPSSTVESADGTVHFRGTGQPRSAVILRTGTKRVVINTRVGDDGRWEADGWLSHQSYILTSYYTVPGEPTVRDVYGIVVVPAPSPLTVDRPVDGSTVTTPDGRVEFSGTGHPGARAIVTAGNDRQVLNVPVRPDGTWSGTAQLGYQWYELSTRQVIAGRDDTVGSVRVLVRPEDDRPFTVTSPTDAEPVDAPDGFVDMTGTGLVGAGVTVRDTSEHVIGRAVVQGTGEWSLRASFAPGEHTVRVTHTLLGTEPIDVDLRFTVRDDLVVQPFALDTPADGSTVASPDNVVLFEGRGAAGATVEIVNGSGREVVRTVVKDDGTWRATGGLGWQVYTLDYTHTPGPAGGARATGSVVYTIVPH